MAEGQKRQMFEVFTIVKRAQQSGEPKSYWVRVGSAFTNNDGSVNVKLDALPVNGELQLRVPQPREEREEDRGQQRQQTPAQQRGGGRGEKW